jgi:tRNA dimethylallyltransferase
MQKTCIVISGPTAVGKTSIAVELASHFGTEIISADSRQCYKELNVGVAKPDEVDLQKVKHHFINSHSIHESITAVEFEKYALNAIETIFENNDVAILVGGTGLYIKAFCSGLDPIPPVAAEIRNFITQQFELLGMDWLTKSLIQKDADFAKTGEMKNPQRMMRALEVVESTGKSILSFQSQHKKVRDFNIVKFGLELPRPELYDRINLRVDLMMESGLIKEVEALLPHSKLNALQTVGYTELFDFLNGKHSLDEAVNLIKQNSRHYAKRQMTWFKKDESISWVEPDVKTLHSKIQL